MLNKIQEAYLDEDFNTLPISGGTKAGANYHNLTADYTDSETGISFKKGTYATLNSETEIKFKDTSNPQGLSNVKQIIFYLASQGQLQFYAREYNQDTDGEAYVNFEGDPTNRKLRSYKAPGFNTETWTEMNFSKPLKVVVDLTNKQGTDDEMTKPSLDPNKNADDTEVVNSYLQFYEQAKGDDDKIIQGTNLISWTADRRFSIAFKKKAYVMGIALISGTENAKTMFVQNMSHEIRTPLNAIVGFAQVLTSMGDDLKDEEKRNVTKMIADNSDLLTTLVNDIFNFTNTTDKKNYQINMTEVNINNVCRDVIETVRHRKADDVELIFTTELPDDYIVTTDMQRVAQVLINMLTNAEKNTMSGSITLDCNLREHSGMITMSVTDTGVGVPKEKMEEIFQRFNKLNAEKQGAGLGLDICRTIAEKLGGEINIDPEYTGGARFWFTIPCTK